MIDPVAVELVAEEVALIVGEVDVIPTSLQTTDYTLAIDDAATVVRIASDDPVVVTVPADADVDIPVGVPVEVMRYGAGTVTLAAGAGVLLRSPNSWLSIADPYGSVSLLKIDEDEWSVAGNLEA